MSSKTTYQDFLDAVKAYYGYTDPWAEIYKYGLKADDAVNILSQVPGVDVVKNLNGSVRSITYKSFTSYGGYSGGETDRLNEILRMINSNNESAVADVSKSFDMKVPSNVKLNEVTKELEGTAEIGTKVSTGSKVIGALGTIGQAVLAVGTACTLGKTIDKALYNLNPDFWNAHDMETLNPDTWASITNSGSLGDNIFNVLMGVDPDTNETTAYVDQNALAYMALYMQNKGIFTSEKVIAVNEKDIDENFPEIKDHIKTPINAQLLDRGLITYYASDAQYGLMEKTSVPVYTYSLNRPSSTPLGQINTTYPEQFMFGNTIKEDLPYDFNSFTINRNAHLQSYSYDGKAPYSSNVQYTDSKGVSKATLLPTIEIDSVENNEIGKINWLLSFKSYEKNIGIDGVGDQNGATIPDLSSANNINDVLNILMNTLPNLFTNAIKNLVPQPDGSLKEYTYLPFTLPNTSNNNDAQPETGGQTQTKPQVDPDTSPDTLLDLITKLLGNKLDTPNTPDTGSGDTPPSVIPTGSASALYKIYNPSQGELDSFGAWLWSSNFVDQLLKVFNNPMESIIGLHKVYASPVIGGRSNIKVGYLDSGVNSNYVSNQYTKIDCGTINLQEYFGNVFDYSPYTTIELYLPCIGFVQLDVGSVMRSSINITYTVDVLTGACLAEVRVRRDNAGGVLYSYSGNCASQYPLSSGSYMGIVSSVIGVAGSIVGTVASGGSLAPLALGATSGLLNAKTHVQHSGSLSGNSGVMGGKIPYLIITRPQTNMAENYEHFQGLPSNVYTQLSLCHGFTKVKNVNVQNINAESEELEEIKTLLLDGVLI